MKNIIYIILLIFLSLFMGRLADYPSLAFIAGVSWCVMGFLLVRNILKHLTNNK